MDIIQAKTLVRMGYVQFDLEQCRRARRAFVETPNKVMLSGAVADVEGRC